MPFEGRPLPTIVRELTYHLNHLLSRPITTLRLVMFGAEPADPNARWCRRHLQGPAMLQFGRARDSSMNDLHVPTGWGPLEGIVRFCIVDPRVRPLSPGWHRVLAESYRLSLEHFVIQEAAWISQAG